MMKFPPAPWQASKSLLERTPSGMIAVVRVLMVFVALHVPSWMTTWVFQSARVEERPLLNLDLLLAGAIACMSPIAGAFALLLAWTADLIRAASKNYHFMSALDFVDAARFLDMLNIRTYLSLTLVAAVAGLLMCVWSVLSLTQRSRRMALAFLALIVVSAGLDAANGSFHIFGLEKDSRHVINMNFAGSPAWNVWRSQRLSPLAFGPPQPMRDARTFQALRDWQSAHPGQTSMLFLVESMGLPRDPDLRAWLYARFSTSRLAARWNVHFADESFYGSTTWGELRTLCGLQGHYSRLDEHLSKGCLPRQLAGRGVTSIGIHGFGLRMFDRRDWWPRIGLTSWQWSQDFETKLPVNCNQAFPGVCDSAVIDAAVKQAQQPGRFVYALTLDTHLPLDLHSAVILPADLKMLCEVSNTPDEACHLIAQLGDLLDRMGQSLAASHTTPFVVVVGDHAPPFGEAANRQIFVEDRVPLFVLYPVPTLQVDRHRNRTDRVER